MNNQSSKFPRWERGSWKPKTAREKKEWQIACKLLVDEIGRREAIRKKRRNEPELTSEERQEKNTQALTMWVSEVMDRFNYGLIDVEEAEWLLDRPWLHDDYEEVE